jgi:hypothetical protein
LPEIFYVAVDSEGIEHNASGDIAWDLPEATGGARPASAGRQLELRQPIALLDVFDELIFEAAPTEGKPECRDGIMKVSSARLVRQTGWDTETATRFAIECAAHVLGRYAEVPLPDGTTFEAVLSEARRNLDEASNVHAEHLGNLARLFALHRLKKERQELGDIAIGVLTEDNAEDLDALDDPSYEALEPLIDAVLAAIAALRHHSMFEWLEAEEEKAENRAEHRLMERERPLPTPSVTVTPWGPMAVGGLHGPAYEPSWAEAREAARHARTVASNDGGRTAERREAAWQADQLAEILRR